jgi:glutathione synthase/RimK-type ligase-like ATP-grasp enzyme
MEVGLSNRMAKAWLSEFEKASASLGMTHRLINIGADDWMDQVRGLECFVWRLTMSDPSCMAEARTKIPILETMGIRCFPNQKMLWLYDDKVRETFFLRRNGYPTPRTWVFFDQASAAAFVAQAAFPLVAKSHCGAGSGGVMLLQSAREAERLLARMFRKPSLWAELLENYYYIPRLAKGDLLVQLSSRYRNAWPQYVYFQEFLTIDRDWRITTLGHDLVSVFARKNRPDDFRASGSGIWERVEAAELPREACDLALSISNAHGFTSMTYDFMWDGQRWVIGELSYAFVLNAVYTDTLFRREGAAYTRAAATPIGEMHLQAMLDQTAEVVHVH